MTAVILLHHFIGVTKKEKQLLQILTEAKLR